MRHGQRWVVVSNGCPQSHPTLVRNQMIHTFIISFPDHGRKDQIDIDETHGQLLDTLAQ